MTKYSILSLATLLFGPMFHICEARSEMAVQPGPPHRDRLRLAPPETVGRSLALQRALVLKSKAQLRREKWGYGLLGSGFGVAIAGATLIEIDSFGKLGRGGFISAGMGICILIAGMFVLGLPPPNINRTEETEQHQDLLL